MTAPNFLPDTSEQTDPLLLLDFRHFLTDRKLGQVTIKNYVSDVRRFLSWGKLTKPEDISEAVIEVYLTSLRTQLTPTPTLNRYSASLKRFLNFLHLKYQIASNEIVTTSDASTPSLAQTGKIIELFRSYLKQQKKVPVDDKKLFF